ncbi:MAG: hemerythrin domain-containing protein [Paeniglutamicibacter sp.]
MTAGKHEHGKAGASAAEDGHHAADARMADEIRVHHASMVAELERITAALREAGPGHEATARDQVQRWYADVLVPHADEEEATTYAAAGELAEGRLLIEGMVQEHVLIKRLVGHFGRSEGATAAAYATAVLEAFESHQRKENELILPLLVHSPAVSLTEVMGGGHGHQLDGGDKAADHGGHAHH